MKYLSLMELLKTLNAKEGSSTPRLAAVTGSIKSIVAAKA